MISRRYIFKELLNQLTTHMDAYMSTIMGWGPNWPPRNWTLCAGQLLAISQFNAIFALIGTTYGGDGRTSFGIPDLRARVPVAAGQSPGTSYIQIGTKKGAETHTLVTAELPPHTHSVSGQGLSVTIGASSSGGTTNVPSPGVHLSAAQTPAIGPVPANVANIYSNATQDTTIGGGAIAGSSITGVTGSGSYFSIVQPLQAIQFIFCLQGIFPPRN